MSQTPSADESYAVKTIKNVAWLGGSQLFRQFVAIGTTIVLARYLSPTEYGIFAMTLFVNELAQLFIDFGIGSALIQRKEVSQTLLSTCFWANLAIGVLVGVLVVAVGPAAADYFKQPLVQHLLWVSALNLVVTGLVVMPQAVLTRQLAFNHVALGTTIGSLVGAGCTVVLAVMGAGIWSLVFQPLIGTAVNLVYLVWRSAWRPSFEFQPASMKGIMGFSGQLLISNIANHLTRNLQQLIVAPVIGASAMGLLSMAITVAWMPVAQFTSAAVRAIYPVFARLQDSQHRVDAGVRKTISVVSLIAFPTLLGLAVLAPELLIVVFGAQWAEAAPLVSVLSGLCLVQSVTFLVGSTLLARGRADLTMKISLASVPIVAAALWSAREHSILWVTVALTLSHLSVSLLTLHLSLRGTQVGWRGLLATIFRPLVCTLLMALILWLAKQSMLSLPQATRLLTLIGIGAVSYLLMSWFINRKAVDELIQLFARKKA